MKRRTFLKGILGALGTALVPVPRLPKPRVEKPKIDHATILSESLRSPELCNTLALCMAFPICRRFQYNRLARQIFPIQHLPMGAVPYYSGA